MQQPTLHRLTPTPSVACTIAEAYAAPLGAHADRPWVGLCMVASIDGSTVVDGASAGLSSANDSGVLLQLRAVADVVVVGAGTARNEGYGPPRKPGQRIGVVTASGRVDTASKLFASGAGFVITTEEAVIDGANGATVDVIRSGRDVVDLRGAIEQIPSICRTSAFIQAEGGATLNGALLDRDLFDELNLTTAPAAVGGSGPRLMHEAGDHQTRFDLMQLAIDDESFVFSRWRRRTFP